MGVLLAIFPMLSYTPQGPGLKVGDLFSYLRNEHLQQTAKFLFVWDRSSVNLRDEQILELNRVWWFPSKGVVFNLGSFCVRAFCCHFNLQLLFRYAQLSLKLLLPECLLLLLSFSCHALLPPPVNLPFFLSISSFFCLCLAESTSEILSLSCIKRAKMFFLSFFHYRTSRGETPESNLMPSNCGTRP